VNMKLNEEWRGIFAESEESSMRAVAMIVVGALAWCRPALGEECRPRRLSQEALRIAKPVLSATSKWRSDPMEGSGTLPRMALDAIEKGQPCGLD
jgi:hypothetical protein